MRILGTRSDGALAVDVGGVVVVLHGDRVSPPVEWTEVERLGPWAELSGVRQMDRRNVTRLLDAARMVPLAQLRMLGDVPGHPFRGNQHMGGGAAATSRANAESTFARHMTAQGSHGEAARAHEAAMKAHRRAAGEQDAEGNAEQAREHTAAARGHENQAKFHMQRSVTGGIHPSPSDYDRSAAPVRPESIAERSARTGRSEGDLTREAQRHAAEDVRDRMARTRATLPVTPGPSDPIDTYPRGSRDRSRGVIATKEIAHAAANDVANTAMREAGRTKWSVADYNKAVRTRNRLMGPNK